MDRKLPPLNALRAFEAAARHESLTKAAAELNVTHAAISRHVRELEANLRVALFVRTGRGVILTETGRTLAADLTEVFDLLARATSRFVRSGKRRQKLTITSDMPFAAYWLVPRLGRFTSTHPDIDLVLDPNPRLVDFRKEDADLGIRFGPGQWRDVEAEKLFDAELTVVCSPKLLSRRPLNSPADLPPGALIQEQDRSFWQRWLEVAGVAHLIAPSGPTLLADLTVSAAEAGHGYALSDRLLAADALAAKRLVAPFDITVRCDGYYLVRGAALQMSKAAIEFRRWIIDAMTRTIEAQQRIEASTIESRGRETGKRKGHGAAAPSSGTKRTRNPLAT